MGCGRSSCCRRRPQQVCSRENGKNIHLYHVPQQQQCCEPQCCPQPVIVHVPVPQPFPVQIPVPQPFPQPNSPLLHSSQYSSLHLSIPSTSQSTLSSAPPTPKLIPT